MNNQFNSGADNRAVSKTADPNAGIAANYDVVETAPGTFSVQPKAVAAPDNTAEMQQLLDNVNNLGGSFKDAGARSSSYVFGSTHEAMSEGQQQQFNVSARGEELHGGVVINGQTYSPEQMAALRGQAEQTMNQPRTQQGSTMANWAQAQGAPVPQAPQAPGKTSSGKASGWWRKG